MVATFVAPRPGSEGVSLPQVQVLWGLEKQSGQDLPFLDVCDGTPSGEGAIFKGEPSEEWQPWGPSQLLPRSPSPY